MEVVVIEENNKPKVKIGDNDITNIVLEYEILRNSERNILKISIPIDRIDMKIATKIDF